MGVRSWKRAAHETRLRCAGKGQQTRRDGSARIGKCKTGATRGKERGDGKMEVEERKELSGMKKCRYTPPPMFCAKSAQTIERKGVELPRSARE